jgi:tetratricopeptide (TPR) repeat protein
MSRNAAVPRPSDRRFLCILGGILLGGLLLRVAYLLAQPAADPFFAHPAFDGAYYLSWARAIAYGSPGPTGAFYLAPLYPHLLAMLIKIIGGSYLLLYLLQHLLSVATAAMIAILGRHLIGHYAALAASALFLLYHPILFFASRPLSETLSLFLLFAALLAGARSSARSAAGAGFLAGLAALSRPNLLLLPLLWAAGEGKARRFQRVAIIAGCALFAILPVTLRNFAISGHAVLISSNGGLTAYHGNGPNAHGLYTPTPGFSGEVGTQREEATTLARARSGLQLDDVEADSWWGRQALQTRLQDPAGSLALLARRLALTIDNHEHGLDYAPALDRNPWRPLFVVPLALLLGLSVSGVILRGFRKTGGWWTWSAILSCAMAPLLFYVSSRYRLPAAALLTLPAGCGLVDLLHKGIPRRATALTCGAVVCAISLLVPFHDLKATVMGEGLANRAVAYLNCNDLESAELEAAKALELAPASALVNFNAGVVEDAAGRPDRAEAAYRRSLGIDAGLAEAAANLGKILIFRSDFKAAVVILERALRERPTHQLCWNNLVLAYTADGQGASARAAVRRARANGVLLDPAMLQAIGIE